MTAAAEHSWFDADAPNGIESCSGADNFGGLGGTESFDDTDGAYATAEPDPFAEQVVRPLRRPSLRVELGDVPARPIAALARPQLPALPVPAGLQTVLPGGLQRGSTLAVTSSVSLLLALLSSSSARGAWAAMVGMPAISADAADEAGIDLQRLAIISSPEGGWTPATWTTAVGALLDAVDIVIARPGCASGTVTGAAGTGAGAVSPAVAAGSSAISDGDARRLSARARSKDSVLLLFGQQGASWPVLQVTLSAQHTRWSGIGNGHGRITARQLTVSATGRGRSAQPRTGQLWLPIEGAPIEKSVTAPDEDLISRAG